MLIINNLVLIQGQESCIFGDGHDCYFPCACTLRNDSVRSCDPITGHCFCGKCLEGYKLKDTGGGISCQPP